MSKWVRMAMTINKTDEEVKSVMNQIQDAMIRTGKMTKDMDKAMDILTGINTQDKGDWELIDSVHTLEDEGSQ
jgi:hypothetical protein